VISGRTSWVGSTRGRLPLTDSGRLGGLLNLTGFAAGQLGGDDVAYAQLRGERVIGRAPLGLRAGLALEAGRVGLPYTRQVRAGERCSAWRSTWPSKPRWARSSSAWDAAAAALSTPIW